jgi:N-acetylmuramoyl-L-alanine amidase
MKYWMVLAFLLLTSCSSTVSESIPPEQKVPLLVCLDAGHGGSDPGAMDSEGQRMEKDDNLKMTLAVASALEDLNVEYFLTRDTDTYIELKERSQLANSGDATLFVSLHRNIGGGSGVEIWVNVEADSRILEFAQDVFDHLETVGIQKNRGIKRGSQGDPLEDYSVNLFTQMDSCIIELGFMDNPEDNDLWDLHYEEYALAIARAISNLAP